jgi:NAD(P)-dependent dehydrogenase (short-subunit alcohol dehydrogenase family)
MELEGKTVVVTGGTRGLGLGLVEALAERGAEITVVARNAQALQDLRSRLGVNGIAADITDQAAANRILAQLRPEVLVLNAGTTPASGPMDRLSWAAFTKPWDIDVKGGLYWIQAALNTPLPQGARVLVGSSGAALQGSPLSGGYAGAKRMLWLMARYANGISDQKGLGVRFQAVVPQQMVAGTGVGDVGAGAYSEALGIEPSEFLARFGAPLPPRRFGELIAEFLQDPHSDRPLAVGVKGDTGITVLEGETA